MRVQALINLHRCIKSGTIFLLILIFVFTGSMPVYADRLPEHDIDSLVELANQKQLHQERQWHLLLHYRTSFLGKVEGQEDGLSFYNSPIGKTDPQAELSATLRRFFEFPSNLKKDEEHPQCVFPARYKWLKRELGFDSSQLPEQSCPRLEGWMRDLNPEKITLVFSSFYMNNPASMFGHTLLRIDTEREGLTQKLLNYGVNYAAIPDTENALLYVLKGLFGFFKGEFALFPYYVKVQTYSNMESRDLWEYELNFTEDQMNTFLLHLWELGGNYFDYYYFQENCSYHILSLLEVANPDLHLTDQFLFHVIPSDTVKALTRYDDLVSKIVYRPSLLSQMSHKEIQMTEDQRRLLGAIIDNPSTIQDEHFGKRDVAEKALVLDTFLDYAQYINMREKKEESDPAFIKNREVLLARSQLRIRPEYGAQSEFSTRPELGHGSDRLKIGFGIVEGEAFEELAYRPAYHDLLARDAGFGKGSQILFLDVTARHYNDIGETKLERLDLIDIVSLTPYDRLFNKKSWRFNIGVDTIKDFDCSFCNAFKSAYGIGLSYKSADASPLTLYAMADAQLEVSNRLNSDYRVGGGGTIGIFFDPIEKWRIQALGNYLRFPLGHDSEYYRITLNQRYALSQNIDLRLELNQIKKKGEWLFSVNLYF